MIKIINTVVVLLVFFNNFGDSQVRNVRLVNHVDYFIGVVQATIDELEHRGWCNLKLPETVHDINETVFDREALGTVTYTNGFLVSVQHVDIQQSTVQQVWSWSPVGSVDVKGRLRMHNVVVGFDVLVNLTVGDYQYTGTFLHPMVNFDFSIVRDLNEDTITPTVVGVVPASTHLVRFMPRDNITDVLNSLYVKSSTIPGILAWGTDVLTPIVHDLIVNKIQFPTVCYNCAA